MKRCIYTLITLILVGNYLFSQNSIIFTAKLDGNQTVPAVTTTAVGTGTFVLSSSGTQVTYHVTVNGLSGSITGAHFHNGAMGVGGGVVKTLSFAGNTTSGVWGSADANQPFTDSLLSELLRGRLYINVHTSANPNGEIRGQVLLTSGVEFTAKLDGSQETSAVTTTASGTGSVRLNTDGTVTYELTAGGLTPTASHFHNASAGVSGGVVKTIALSNNKGSGTWSRGDATQPFTDFLLRELVKGRLYLNVHTSTNPGGEIRGQILASSDIVSSVKGVEVPSMPQSFILTQNYPNPFNPTTIIAYALPYESKVSVLVYNTLGQIIRTFYEETKEAGHHNINFNGEGLSSGVYFYSINAVSLDGKQNFQSVKKMMLLK